MKASISKQIHKAVDAEFNRAFKKHHGHTPRHHTVDDREALIILCEEIGEVARAMTYDEGGDIQHLAEELIQTGTMALAWADRLLYGADK